MLQMINALLRVSESLRRSPAAPLIARSTTPGIRRRAKSTRKDSFTASGLRASWEDVRDLALLCGDAALSGSRHHSGKLTNVWHLVADMAAEAAHVRSTHCWISRRSAHNVIEAIELGPVKHADPLVLRS